MKKTILILILFTMIAGCKENKNSSVDPKSELPRIQSVLTQYIIANEDQDFGLIRRIWATDDNIIMIGTDSDERLVGWDNIKRAIQHQFKEFRDTYITVSDQIIRINKTGNTASFSELLNYNFIYKDEAKSFTGMRFTGVLEKIDGAWLLVQGHLSIPAEVELNEVY